MRLGDRGGTIAGRDPGSSGEPAIAELIRKGRILHADSKQINRGVSDFDEAVRTVLSPVPLFPRYQKKMWLGKAGQRICW